MAKTSSATNPFLHQSLVERKNSAWIVMHMPVRIRMGGGDAAILHPADLRAKFRLNFARGDLATPELSNHQLGNKKLPVFANETGNFVWRQDWFSLTDVEMNPDAQYRRVRHLSNCILARRLIHNERGARNNAFTMSA